MVRGLRCEIYIKLMFQIFCKKGQVWEGKNISNRSNSSVVSILVLSSSQQPHEHSQWTRCSKALSFGIIICEFFSYFYSDSAFSKILLPREALA